MNKLATIFCISTVLLFHPNAKVWSGAGHQVIAAEAYRQLSPGLKKKVTEILKAHPDYETWEKSFTSDSANLDLPTFIFMRSSTWADEIRRRKSPYNHPKWHFVDCPCGPAPILWGLPVACDGVSRDRERRTLTRAMRAGTVPA